MNNVVSAASARVLIVDDEETQRNGLASMIAVYRRELLSYVTTPTAYVFIAVFLFAISLFTFQVGGFFDARVATDNAPLERGLHEVR